MYQVSSPNQRPASAIGSTNLYLVDPVQKFSHQFAALRNQLQKNNIPFQSLVRYDEVKNLINDKQRKNMIVVDSSNLEPGQFPKQIFNSYNNKIYFYPFRYENLLYLPSINEILNQYRTQNGLSIQKQIKLRSIKKDLLSSLVKRQNRKQYYSKINILQPRRNNPKYTQLLNSLQLNKKITAISRQNEVNRQGNSLLILDADSYESIDKFLISNRLTQNVDLAIFGYIPGFSTKLNGAIMTSDPKQIIQYLREAGVDMSMIPKYKLMNQNQFQFSNNNNTPNYNLNLLNKKSDQNFNLNNNNSGIFGVEEGKQLSFAANNENEQLNNQRVFNQKDVNPMMIYQNVGLINTVDFKNLNNGVNAKNIDILQGENVTYDNKGDINMALQSKVSQASNKNKNSQTNSNSGGKMVIKKIAKKGTNQQNNVNIIQNMNTSRQSINSPVPNINIITANSQASQKSLSHVQNTSQKHSSSNNIVNSPVPIQSNNVNINNMQSRAKKGIMQWNLKIDRNKQSEHSKGPKFIMSRRNNNNLIGSQNSIKMYESRKSESESSKLISEVPLIVNPVPNFNSSNNINLNNNTGTNKSLPVDNNNSLGSSGTIMGSNTNPGPLPPKYMPPSPKLPQSPTPSEKIVNIGNSSSTQIINDGNSEHKLKIEEQIRKKYGTSPIRQVTQQYRNSSLSNEDLYQNYINSSSNTFGIKQMVRMSSDPTDTNPESPQIYNKPYNSEIPTRVVRQPIQPQTLQIKTNTTLGQGNNVNSYTQRTITTISSSNTQKIIDNNNNYLYNKVADQIINSKTNGNPLNANTTTNIRSDSSSGNLVYSPNIQLYNGTNTANTNRGGVVNNPQYKPINQTINRAVTSPTPSSTNTTYNTNTNANTNTNTNTNNTNANVNVNINYNNANTNANTIVNSYANSSRNSGATGNPSANMDSSSRINNVTGSSRYSSINQTINNILSSNTAIANNSQPSPNSNTTQPMIYSSPTISQPMGSLASTPTGQNNITGQRTEVRNSVEVVSYGSRDSAYDGYDYVYDYSNSYYKPLTNSRNSSADKNTVNNAQDNRLDNGSTSPYIRTGYGNMSNSNNVTSTQGNYNNLSNSNTTYNNNNNLTNVSTSVNYNSTQTNVNTLTNTNTINRINSTNSNSNNSINNNTITSDTTNRFNTATGNTTRVVTSPVKQSAAETVVTTNISNIINSFTPSTNMKNYMTNLGINEQDYEIILQPNGKKIYKLKSKEPVKSDNNTSQAIDRYKSAPKLSLHETSEVKSPLSPREVRKNVFNLEQYNENVDQNGKVYYTLKKSMSKGSQRQNNVVSPSLESQKLLIQSKTRQNGISSVSTFNSPKNNNNSENVVVNNGYSTYTYGSSVQKVTQPKNINVNDLGSNRNVSSYNKIYNPYAYTQNNTQTNKNSINMNTATGNTNVYNNMSSNMSSNINRYETSFHTYRSDTQMDKNNKLHEGVQSYSNNNLYNNTRNLYNNNDATILAKKEQLSKSPDGNTKVYQNYEKKVDPMGGSVYQINKRYEINPQKVTRQAVIKEQGPNIKRQVYEYHSQSTNKVQLLNDSNQNNSDSMGKKHESRPSIIKKLSSQAYDVVKQNKNSQTQFQRNSQFSNSSNSNYEYSGNLFGQSQNNALKSSGNNPVQHKFSFGNKYNQYDEQQQHREDRSNNKKIYIQNPHKNVDKQINQKLPGQYDIRFFNKISEIQQKSRDNFVILHRQADNIGYEFDRDLGTLLVLGGQRGDRLPKGSVNMPTLSYLIQNIL